MYNFDYSSFIGTFRNDMRHGLGEFIKRNGAAFEQLYDNGFLVSEQKKNGDDGVREVKAGQIERESEPSRNEAESDSLPFNFDLEEVEGVLAPNSGFQVKEPGPETLSMVEFNDRLAAIDGLASKPVAKWDDGDIALVLEDFGLGAHSDSLAKNKVKGKALLLLKDDDIGELGITKVAERIKTRELIKKIRILHEQQKQQKRKHRGDSKQRPSGRGLMRRDSMVPQPDSEQAIIEEESKSDYTEKSKGDAKVTRSCHNTRNHSELRMDRKSSRVSAIKNQTRRYSSRRHTSGVSVSSFKSERGGHRRPARLLVRSRSLPATKSALHTANRPLRPVSYEHSSKSWGKLSLHPNPSHRSCHLEDSLKGSTSSSRGSDESDSAVHRGQHRLRFDYNDEIGPNLRNFLINKDDLDIIEPIGEGAYGQVFRGRYLKTDVAVKIFNKTKFKYKIRKNFIQEAELLCSFRSPFIVLFMGFCLNYKDYMIITEYMSQGSLHDLLHRRKAKIGIGLTLSVVEQVAHGMNHLHEKKVLHCDLKSSNILVG